MYVYRLCGKGSGEVGFKFCGTEGLGFIGDFQSWGWSGVGLNLTVAGGRGAILLTPCRSLVYMYIYIFI